MARSFADVLAEVTAKSDPQRQIVLGQIAGLPTQQAADESSLAAKKDQAYQDITDAARRRGLGFSGIPLGEQAKYAATDYAPAIANLKSTYNGRKATLESALADIGKNDYTSAYDIYNQDRNFEEQQRQFNENLALQKQQAASSNALASLYGGGKQAPATPQPQVDPTTQQAYNAVQELLNTNNPGLIQKTYDAIKKSASYGNAYDQIKLRLIEQLYPSATSFGQNTVALGPARPTVVPMSSGYSGLSVGVANPGRLR